MVGIANLLIIHKLGGGKNSLLLIFHKHRQLFAQTLFHIFRFVFPHEAVGFILAEQAEKSSALIVGYAVERLHTFY